MAYHDDAVLAKLSALNETQESIQTTAQWVMFHRRHADRTGTLWLQRLKESTSNKRLNLIYLANEVAQQTKARKKDDFLLAFSPVIAEATATAYKGASVDVQQKLRRVVEVWRQRSIFEIPIQEAVEARLDEADKTRGVGKRGLMDGSEGIFSRSAGPTPAELVPLVNPSQTVTKLSLSTKTSLNAANLDYDKLTDPNSPPPTAPVYAARLNGLMKTLANAEGAVAESIKARKLLIEGLEKMLIAHKATMQADEDTVAELRTRRQGIETKKHEVEASIMRGYAVTGSPDTPGIDGETGSHTPTTPAPEPERPEVEALTPPDYQDDMAPPPLHVHDQPSNSEFIAAPQPIPMPQAGEDLLASLASGYHNSYGANRELSGGSSKKRKLEGDEFGNGEGDALDDLDPDVAAMLRGGQ